ncbi:hypothetical protein SKAU_G00422540 [Synaphobranchus kaupii]|uniref:Stabilin-1 n=1 Tax=Synaphobranchus kaupii TaxID=118154 RepID=A0A9Q1I9E5_SYNKA|nr:hypothetical protein SKAU_G00422540 [Synaphobranchus kaupii]
MHPFLLLAAIAICDAQHQQVSCDEERTVHFPSICTSCAAIQATPCPSGTHIVSKSTQSNNCRYTVKIGGKSKMLPGCSHTCETVVTEHSCCPETWGPLCLPCPSWAGRTCNGRGTCMDRVTGNGTCVCEEGFTGFACHRCLNKKAYGEDCASECKCLHGECNNGPSGDGACYCKPPYTGPRCDQVSASCWTCSAHAYCKKTGQTETCKCLPGFKKDGLTCTGNMCSLNVCDRNADCAELDPGRFQCRCKVGYEGNGEVCVPLNPCTSNNGDCPANSTVCVYTSPGRSRCVCRRGFEGSTPETGCRLKSACTPDNCHWTARCLTGLDAMPRCTCDAEQIGDGTRCYGNILEQLLELNRGTQQGKLTGAIRLFEKGCQLTLSKYGPFTAFIPVLTEALNGISEAFVCKNHLILNQKVLKELKGKDFWTLGTEELRFRDDQTFLFKKDPYKIYSVIQGDIPAANGIIHIIDGPITNLHPHSSDSEQLSKMTIGEILANDPKYKTFQALLDSSGLLLPLRGPGPLTVFVPTNDALAKFSHFTIYMQEEATHKLEGLVKHHISSGAAVKVEELAGSGPFQTIGNDPVYITCHEDGRLEFDETGIHLDTADILASNGIIHVIDGVLVPTSIQPIFPHRCEVTESKVILGLCKSCRHLNETHCPMNNTEMEGHMRGCTYLIGPYNYKGCAKYCNSTETRMDCCKGFYGKDCKPCLGGFQNPCHDGGKCLDGIRGDGSCICEPRFTGAACHVCTQQNKYGENCEQDCRCHHGTCDNRRHSSGVCRVGSCVAGFSGELCELRVTVCSEYQTETCHYQADCVLNITGQLACVCRLGYEGDGTSCLPANPCLRPQRGGCDRNAQCVYTDQGKVLCVCVEGWTGDGEVCTHINNCLLESRGHCHDNADCTALGPGENECTCKPGYQGNGKTCDIINPCYRRNGGCHYRASCQFSESGAVNCSCPDLFMGNGTMCYGTVRMELDAEMQFYWFNEWIQNSGFTGLEGNITALVPSYRASHSVFRDKFWTDPYRIKYLLKAHILVGAYSSNDLMQLDDKEVATLDPEISWKVENTDNRIIIGNATIITADIYALNGFIHIIDKALFPPLSHVPPLPPTLGEYLNSTPTFSLFNQALLLYNLTDEIKAKETTILLPTDQAVMDHLNRTNSTELDEDTVKYHIVPEIRLFPQDVRTGMIQKTLLEHHQIMFHVGMNNESMANEVLLDGNVTEVRYMVLIHITHVLEIHKNICERKVKVRSRGVCGPCDETPRCYSNSKPMADNFPSHMKSNCKYRKRTGRIRLRASGCVLDCFLTKEEEMCCPGFYGHSCYKCPSQAGQVCSNRGQCQDGLTGSGECVCQQGFNGTACETCEPGRYGTTCESVCRCSQGECMDGVKGSGRCLCYKGWRGSTCSAKIVADECGGICDINANCGSATTCICIAGYQGNGTFCKEINPCDQNNGDCSKNANCTKTSPGERTCTCHHGYTGDGLVCLERDPCSDRNGGCHQKAACFAIGPRQVVCKCMAGYAGNGISCNPMNPCRNYNGGCSSHAWCVYRGPDQRNCTCRSGYIGDGFTCRGRILSEIKRHADASWFYRSYMNSKVVALLEDGPFTAFIPHKDFVNNLTMELWTNANSSKDLLRNHLVSCEKLLLSDLQSAGELVTMSGHRLHFSTKEGILYINEKTKIITSNEIAFDGVFHFIDGILFPYDLHNHSKVDPTLNVSAAAEAYGYTTFSKLLQDSRVERLVQSQSYHRPITMLWPSDHAFHSLSDDLRPWLFGPDHTQQLPSYIKAHIIRDVLLVAAMLPSLKSARTMFGSSVSFRCDRNTVGDIAVDDGNAKIIERHLEFDGGIAYGIDQLLEPPGLGARCDVHEERKIMGTCRSCFLTPRCLYGVFTGKVSPCQLSLGSFRYSGLKMGLTRMPTVPKTGCGAECALLEWRPRCCKRHYGRDCQVCPGGLDAPCSNHGACDDGQQGTGKCTCDPGFNGTACELCTSAHYGPNCTACSCTENGRCDDTLQGYGSCFCQEGWNGVHCEIKLEAKPVCSPTCHPKAVCQPENTCQCEPLYEGDGRTCTAPDLCQDYNGGCHLHASCVQDGVQVTCLCLSGYTGDGVTCSPINRCVQEENGGCNQMATCLFTGPNERECQCLPGYVGNGVQCLESVVPPVDRCLEDNGGCDPKARCKDLHFHESTAGVFHLNAPEGRYKLNYTKAQAVCEGEGATLASVTQLSHAQQVGMHLCVAGWLDGAQVGFPTRFPSLFCGNNHVGVVTYKSPVDTSNLYDAYCYRLKDVSCNCGPEYVGNGDFCNGNLASVVATNTNFSVFYTTLLKLASSSKQGERLMDFLSTPSASVTLFVPQDSGFTANQTLTWRDVEYHISTNNSLHFYGNLEHGAVVRSRLGYNLSVTLSTANTISSSVLQPSKLVNSQRIIDWDIPATNGIIHVIEGPLKAPPPAVGPAAGTDRAWPHSGPGATGPVLAVGLLIGAAAGLVYYLIKRKKEPYQFRYYKQDEDDDDDGSHAQEEGRPPLVYIPNPLYGEETQCTPH